MTHSKEILAKIRLFVNEPNAKNVTNTTLQEDLFVPKFTKAHLKLCKPCISCMTNCIMYTVCIFGIW